LSAKQDAVPHFQLTQIIQHLESAQVRLHGLVANVPEAQWAVRPAPNRWSVAECVGHLNLTSQAMLPPLRTGVAQAALLAPQAMVGSPYKSTFVGWLMVLFMGPVIEIGPLHLLRVRTAAAFVPKADEPCATMMATFDRLQGELIALVRESNGRRLSDELVTSLFDSRVKYDVFSAFWIIARHELRHVVQAERAWRDLQRDQVTGNG
jgi:hypothetical protein